MQMPYSYPIDMWSFGCMMAEFRTGEALFTGRSSIEQIIYVCSCIGIPHKNDGLFSLAFL
jgi:serine/threonine protein kinase